MTPPPSPPPTTQPEDAPDFAIARSGGGPPIAGAARSSLPVDGVARCSRAGTATTRVCSSKWLNDALRLEVRPFGIHVSVVEPGAIRMRAADETELGCRSSTA